MLNSKTGFLGRLLFNTLITAIVAWSALNLGLVSLTLEISDNDLIVVSVIVLLVVPLVLELIVHPLEKMLLLNILTLGLFGILARLAIWGATVWYLPDYFRVYHNNFSLTSLSVDDWSKFLCFAAFLAILRLKKED